MSDPSTAFFIAAMALLGAILFGTSYLIARAFHIAINLPRWILLLLGALVLASWLFALVFDAIDARFQDPRPEFHVWRSLGWLHYLLVFGGCVGGCILGGVRAMRNSAGSASKPRTGG